MLEVGECRDPYSTGEYTGQTPHLSSLVARRVFMKEVTGKLQSKGQFGISAVWGGREHPRARKQHMQRSGSKRTPCV